MRALIYSFGGEVEDGDVRTAVSVADVPRPEDADGHVLIKVRRVGVNSADVASIRRGVNLFNGERIGTSESTFIPGGEVVGTRADTGRRVAAICDAGGYAEWVNVRSDRVFDIPDDVDDATALSFLISGLTAMFILRPASRLAPGESIAISGAAGALGSLAVQLAKNFGAGNVIGVASTQAKRDIVDGLGADVTIASAVEGLCARLLAANGGSPIDVATDAAGGETFEQLYRSLAPFGRAISYGSASGNTPPFETRRLIIGSRSVTGLWLNDYLTAGLGETTFNRLVGQFREGRLQALLGPTFSLDHAIDAQEALASGDTIGKVQIVIEEDAS